MLEPTTDPGDVALSRMGALRRVEAAHDGSGREPIPVLDADLERGIAARFARIAREFASRTAIETRDLALSYRELDRRSDAVASWLRDRVSLDAEPVAIGTQDPIAHVVALLGVLKAGGFYLPVPRTWTDQQRQDVLGRIRVAAFLETVPGEAGAIGAPVALVDTLTRSMEVRPSILAPPSRHAYVMFTSGSTGVPKGVVQDQRNLLHNVAWQTRDLRVTAEDRLSQLHSEASMGAIRAFFNALLNGATLCPFSVKESQLDLLEDWLRLRRPSILHCSASLFRVLVRSLASDDSLASVRLMILGGEAVLGSDFEAFSRRFTARTLLCTGLGSTETTTVRMMLLPPGARPESHQGRLPLGFAVPDVQVELTDRASAADGSGETGLIRIASPFLFPGYWPVAPDAGPPGRFRVHDMGDLALRRPDGVLYHIGRRDDQVKIRGHRFDLLEMDQVVRKVTGVADCAVLPEVDGSGDTRLHVFAVPVDPTALSCDKIRYFLRKRFPAHLQPSQVFLMDTMPRQAGGKTDRAGLRAWLEGHRTEGGDADRLDSLRKRLPSPARKLLKCFEKTSYPFLRRWAQHKDTRAPFGLVPLRDLDIDSLTALEICLNIERLFHVQVSAADLVRYRRVKDLLDFILGHGPH